MQDIASRSAGKLRCEFRADKPCRLDGFGDLQLSNCAICAGGNRSRRLQRIELAPGEIAAETTISAAAASNCGPKLLQVRSNSGHQNEIVPVPWGCSSRESQEGRSTGRERLRRKEMGL